MLRPRSVAASAVSCELLRLSTTGFSAADDQTDSRKPKESAIATLLILKAVIGGDRLHLSEAAIGGLPTQN